MSSGLCTLQFTETYNTSEEKTEWQQILLWKNQWQCFFIQTYLSNDARMKILNFHAQLFESHTDYVPIISSNTLIESQMKHLLATLYGHTHYTLNYSSCDA